MLVVAVDFDGVLSEIKIQNLVKKFRLSGVQVWVVTARKETTYNIELIEKVICNLGISSHQVIYCNEKPKFELIEALNADIYIDNINKEFLNINTTKTVPLLYSGF
jgi:CTP synthase (UTP-ammonia lyase)